MKSTILRITKREAIKAQIRRWIADHGLRQGDMISGQNKLAKHFGVTPLTVHRAISELCAEGLLYRCHGKGTFVNRVESLTTAKKICLVLPGENMDEPERNPTHWPYVQRLFRIFHEATAGKHVFSILSLMPGENPPEIMRQMLDLDICFFTNAPEYRRLIRYLTSSPGPRIVAFGEADPGLRCMTLDQNRVESVRRGIRYLIELGYRRIAFMGSHGMLQELSFQGYAKALREHGLTVDSDLVLRDHRTPADGSRGAETLLKHGVRCDAVFVDGDPQALAAVDYFQRHGVRVPEDIGVMGYDGLDCAVRQPPFLTTVRVPYEEMVDYALQVLTKTPEPEMDSRHLAFAGEVSEGRTCCRQQPPADLAIRGRRAL